jgi:hypothetical protein
MTRKLSTPSYSLVSKKHFVTVASVVMPPERNRVSNPQGRQKSCAECAKAKRRCDLQQPHCLRCTRQKLTCVYPPQPYASKVPALNSPVDNPVAGEGSPDAAAPFLFNIDIPNIAGSETEPLSYDFNVAIDPFSSCSDQDPDRGLIINIPTPRSASPTASSSSMSAMFALSARAESRVGYPLEQMKRAPSMFVEKNATPWSHPLLYEDFMPNSMQGATPGADTCHID